MGQRRLDRVPRREKGLPANSRRGLASLRPLVRLRSGAFSEPAHQGKTPWERRPWPLQAPGRLLPFHAPGQTVDVLQNVGRPREPSPGPSRARPGRIRGARNPGHGHGSLQTHLPRNRRAQLPLNRPRGRARLWPRLSVGFPPLVFVQSPGRFQHLATPCTVSRQAPLSMEILQARILEWAVMLSSGIHPKSPALQVESLLSEPPGKASPFHR